ncbi:MAG: phenylacetate--CoA ligase family protein [candidate division NC10 bacterium]|nr:phenylacetate--CoA ligase family protein [candidate division NC10 bacterium]
MDALYRWLVPRLIFPLYDALSGRRLWTEVRRLREAQWQAPADLEARAARKLRHLLGHAAAQVPYYRDLFARAQIDPTGIRTLADLARVPITTKSDLRAHFPGRTTAANLPARRRQPMTTSGSTGLPFAFYADTAAADVWLASYLFFREWAGAPLWETRVHIAAPPHFYERGPLQASRGRVSESPLLRRLLLGERVVWLSGPDLTLEAFLACLRALGRRHRYFLFAFPSHAAELATHLLASGRELPVCPTVVIAYAEDLTPARAAQIQRAFRCPVVNHYSSLEVLHMAQSCPENPPLFHVNSERVILRIVRADGTPASPGQRGRVVVTDLANSVMPFINYDQGDWAVAGPPCPCGRGFPTLARLEGREDEAIRTLGGKTMTAVSLERFLLRVWGVIPYVAEYQAVQAAPGAVLLQIVPTLDFNQAVSRRLAADLAEWLGPGMTVTVEPVARIDPEPSGKRLTIKASLPS